MNVFRFPQPGETRNPVAVPVTEPVLTGLLALAIVGLHHLQDGEDSFASPQMLTAFHEAGLLLSEQASEAAYTAADDAEDALRQEYPF